MSTPMSITADKDLVSGLQRPICNPVVGHSRSEDTFCLSSPDNWPDAPAAGGIDQVQLEYPSASAPNSLPGTEYFCADYLNWLGRLAPTDSHTNESNSYLKEINATAESADRYIEGIAKLSDFCRSVQDAQAQGAQRPVHPSHEDTPPAPVTPPTQPTSWWDDVLRFIDEYTALVVSALTTVGGFLLAVAVAMKKFQTGVFTFLRALLSWQNLKYLFSFKKVKLELDHSVVMSQLKGQVSRLPGAAADFFKGLEFEVEKYATDDVIKRFNSQAHIWQRIHLYLDQEKRPPFGLPWSQIEAYVKGRLTLKNRDPLRRAAAREIANEITASLDDSKILRQFIAKRESIKSELPIVQEALVSLAIASWKKQDDEDRFSAIDLTVPAANGVFPKIFVDRFLIDENIELARRESENIRIAKSGGAGTGPGSLPPPSVITGASPSPESPASSSGGTGAANRSMLQSAFAFAGSPSPAASVQNQSPLVWAWQMFCGARVPLAFAPNRIAR